MKRKDVSNFLAGGCAIFFLPLLLAVLFFIDTCIEPLVHNNVDPWVRSLRADSLRPKKLVEVPLKEESSLVGFYAVTGTQKGDDYDGVAQVSLVGTTHIIRYLVAGESYLGVGIRHGDKFSVSWNTKSAKAGVTVYTIKTSGTLEGIWTQIPVSERHYVEIMTPLVKK